MSGVSKVVGVVLVLICLAGCDFGGEKPDDALAKFLDARSRQDWETAYSLISNDDKAIESFADYSKVDSDFSPSFLSEIRGASKFKILKTERNSSKAKVTVEATEADVAKLIIEKVNYEINHYTDLMAKSNASQYIEEKYHNHLPMLTETETYDLIKEDSGWRVFLGLRVAREMQSLIAESQKYQKEKKYDESRALLLKAKAISSDGSTIDDLISNLDKEIAEDKAMNEYVDKVQIFDVAAKYYEGNDGSVPGITFKIRNVGNRELTEIDIIVYFKDKSGNTIAEKTYYPVLPSKSSLKPGYIWQIERGKFYSASSVSDEWKTGSVAVNVALLKFAQ